MLDVGDGEAEGLDSSTSTRTYSPFLVCDGDNMVEYVICSVLDEFKTMRNPWVDIHCSLRQAELQLRQSTTLPQRHHASR